MNKFRLTALSIALALVVSLATIATASAASRPTGLEAELCGDSVCLSWNPGSSEFTYQKVLSWEGSNLFDRYYGKSNTIGPHIARAQVSLDSLNLEPAENAGETVAYSFQVVGVDITGRGGGPANHYSNRVMLNLPRPVIEPPPVVRIAPSDLAAEICGDAVCLNWTAGEGDFTYQEVVYWKTGDPGDLYYRGGIIVRPYATEKQFNIAEMNRHSSDDGNVSYTFQVTAIKRYYGKYAYVGRSNEATTVVAPAQVVAPASGN